MGDKEILDGLMARGVDHFERAEYRAALEVWLEAKRFADTAFGPDGTEAATAHRRLASAYEELSDWPAAFAHHTRSIAIFERTCGLRDTETARGYNNLGIHHWKLGRFPEALGWFERALEIHEANYGPNHSLVADVVNNIGMIHYGLGNPKRAAQFAERGARITESIHGEMHESTARMFNNTGAFLMVAGDLVRAQNYLERALAIRKVVHGPTHPFTTSTLDNLGELEQRLGHFDRALEHYRAALEANLATYGPDHVEVGRVENNIGSLHLLLNEHRAAITHLERAMRGYAAVGGLLHPTTLDVVANLAEAHLALGQPEEATHALAPALEAFLGFQSRHFPALDAAGKVRYNTTARAILSRYLRAAVQLSDAQHGGPADALSAWLTFKGSATAFETSLSVALDRADSATKREIEALQEARHRLSEIALEMPNEPERVVEHERGLEAAVETVSRLEVNLSARLLEVQEALALRQLSAHDLVAALAPGEAYLDYAWLEGRVLAFVADAQGRVSIHDLGLAEPIMEAIQGLRSTLERPDGAWEESSARLFTHVIAPVIAVLGEATSVVISPDDALHDVPFELLLDERGTLIERFRLRLVPSGRELLRLRRRVAPDAAVGPPSLFGDPDYLDSAAGAYRSGSEPSEPESSGYREWLSGLRFPRLHGSRREIEAIQRLLPGSIAFLGKDANEANLFAVSAPRILHLATHAYIYAGQESLPDPLMCACIGLAGARRSALEGRTGGLVPALRLGGLRLRGTEIVVLSACKSAQGEIRAGEGVAGLNQAFFVAGARSVLSGLWSVPDEETAEFMMTFYEFLTAGLGAAESLRRTKLRYATTLHPHYWAAFVLNGDIAASVL